MNMTHLRVKQHQGALGGLLSTDNGEHALASLVMGDLGDRDARAGETTDLGDFGTATATVVSIG